MEKQKLYIYLFVCFIVIEVAIGEYGTDVLTKLADSTMKNSIVNNHHYPLVSADDQETLMENGRLSKLGLTTLLTTPDGVSIIAL